MLKTKEKENFKFKNPEMEYEILFIKSPYTLKLGKKKKSKKTYKKIEADGTCDDPKSNLANICISSDLKMGKNNKRLLNVVIEELTHAFFWDQPEKKVRPFSTTLTKFLYKMGWRRNIN
ncbi:MAG: hypothetical protein AABY22_32470 [Nanoarchaeota archaeon]